MTIISVQSDISPSPRQFVGIVGLVFALLFVLHRLIAPSLLWWLIPSLLIFAALLPNYIFTIETPRLWPHRPQCLTVAKLLGIGLLGTTCLGFLGIWTLQRLWPQILPDSPPLRHPWLSVFYQFLYIAVAEEYFFRGFIQRHLQLWLSPSGHRTLWIIIISGICFALAHLLIHCQILAGLTFLPGIIFAWSYQRTQCLIVPILLHGWANGLFLWTTQQIG